MRHDQGRWRRCVRLGAVFGALLVVGCTSRNVELRPSVAANTAPLDPNSASATVQRVKFTVDGDAWNGLPKQLDVVVPLQISVENKSGRPIRLQYENLGLYGPEGSRLAALPPRKIEGKEVVSDAATVPSPHLGMGGSGALPGWTANGFWPAGPYADVHALAPWEGPFATDPLYYQTYYARWPVDLPTVDMVTRSLPEGVIENGGDVQGFIFFQDVPQRMERVTFRADLVDAETGERFGTVEIPFRVKDA